MRLTAENETLMFERAKAAAVAGVPTAFDDLFAALMPDLHRRAQALLRGWRPNHTLGPTALVDELFLKLRNTDRSQVENVENFKRSMVTLMRQILIDYERGRRAVKRGDGVAPVSTDTGIEIVMPEGLERCDLLDLHTALERLWAIDPELATAIELRFFWGLTVEEVARTLDKAEATTKRYLRLAQQTLREMLGGAAQDNDEAPS